VIVDAGGGTIDLSTYIRETQKKKLGLMTNTFAEISIPRGWRALFFEVTIPT
jgi:hypothetical protein